MCLLDPGCFDTGAQYKKIQQKYMLGFARKKKCSMKSYRLEEKSHTFDPGNGHPPVEERLGRPHSRHKGAPVLCDANGHRETIGRGPAKEWQVKKSEVKGPETG